MVDGEVAIQMVVVNEILQSRQNPILPNLQKWLQVCIGRCPVSQPENLDKIIQPQLGTGKNLEEWSRILWNDDHMTPNCIIGNGRTATSGSQFEDGTDRMTFCNVTL